MLPILHAKKNAEHRSPPLRFERQLLRSIFLAGVPGVFLSLLLMWRGGYALDHKIEISALILLLWLGLSFSARNHVVDSLRVLSNIISAVRDEDFSFRAAQAIAGDALGDLALEINSLSDALAEERLGSMETTNLLRKVVAEAGTLIFAFSRDNRLRMINQTGARFLGKSEPEILACTAQELGIADLLEGPSSGVISRTHSGVEKRWIVRRGGFRQGGEPHRLVVLSEASEVLRAEEQTAWQRLIRVLSHEINNSLAPIRSIAGTLRRMTSNTELPMPIAEHLDHGLDVIHQRAESLSRFLKSYTQLARVGVPARQPVAIGPLIARIAALESRLDINVIPGPDVYISADPDQLEQALINLIKNAVDAVLLAENVSPTAVNVSWQVHGKDIEMGILDEGTGLTETENLFVPFYTTKPSGSGIGLLLTRQIIEAHHGTLTLKNRADRPGCEIEIKLPTCVADSLTYSNNAGCTGSSFQPRCK